MFVKNLEKVIRKENLTQDEMIDSMNQIMENKINDSLKSSFLTAMKIKGETIDEITGAAKVMREKVTNIDLDILNTLDTCGTGGDKSGTYNISTASAFICAANNIPVVKHGNRSVSSKSGSADVLEELGININLKPTQVKKCVIEENIGFFFAPNFHKAMKNIMKTRKELGFKTFFNILGPLTNPAFAKTQILGVYNEELTEPLAKVLKNLGVRKAMVVHGLDGLDEITITDRTKISELKNGNIKNYYISPEDYNIKRCNSRSLLGGDSKLNSKIILDIFNGKKGPKRDILILNSAAALYVNGVVKNIKDGIELAKETIDSKKALEKLNSFKEMTRSF